MSEINFDDPKYIDYESCERLANKRIIAKFEKEIIKSKSATLGINNVIAVLDNLRGEFNIPRIIRSANIFACREVFVIGTPFFNPYPAVGAVRYTRIRFFKNFNEAFETLNDLNYKTYAMAPPRYNGKNLWDLSFNKKESVAFVVGNEHKGLSFNIEDYEGVMPLFIPQHGKTESLNVSVAMSIALAEYDRQQQLT